MPLKPLHIALAALILSAGFQLGSAPAQAQTLADIVAASKAKEQVKASLGNPAKATGGAKTGARAGNALFGSQEFRSGSIKGLPQWQRVIQRIAKEQSGFDACASNKAKCATPAQQSWRQLIRSAQGQPVRERLKAVNGFFNRWPYKQDKEVYGVSEYWATPAEFLRRSGDCEDYAISKFFALRHLGFSAEELRVVILWDEIRRTGHAVLAVYTGGQILILDNLSNMIVPHSRYSNYIPQYSMTENARWAHIHKKKIPTLMASTS